MFKDSKVYIAGHTGLLGSVLFKKLKGQGFSKIIIRTHDELELTDSNAVDEFFRVEKPEYVFLAAGLTGGIIANKTYPASFLHINIAMQDSVFEAANKYMVRHLVFYGSSCVYPKNAIQPMKEEYLMTGEIESTSDAYAISKTTGLVACRSYNNQYKTNRFIALIPNSMYGPNDNFDPENSHVLSAMIRKFHDAKIEGKDKVILWGTGNPRREFIFSEDAADASIFAIQHADRLQNLHYNVGTGADYSIKELALMIASIIGFEGKIEWDATKPDGAQRKLLDSSRFMALGWKHKTTLGQGLHKTVEWFQNED